MPFLEYLVWKITQRSTRLEPGKSSIGEDIPLIENIYVAMVPARFDLLFDSQLTEELTALGKVTRWDATTAIDAKSLAAEATDSQVLITAADCPKLTDEVLAPLPRLGLIAHSGGSVKGFVTPAVFRRNISVTTAADGVASAVAELCLGSCLNLLRNVYLLDRALSSGETWDEARRMAQGRELASQHVGVIGASRTGRKFIGMVRHLCAAVRVFDPYLTDAAAQELGVVRSDLDVLMAESTVVSLNAPVTEQTRRMIGRHELSLLRDGAIVINTSRAEIVDTDALLAELRSGRISAALDVFSVEPIPRNDPLLSMRNVLITPHIGGMTNEGRWKQGRIVVDQVRRYAEGRPLSTLVQQDDLPRIG
jgi:phosphoglycerate dehydrogenase-like enzyme